MPHLRRHATPAGHNAGGDSINGNVSGRGTCSRREGSTGDDTTIRRWQTASLVLVHTGWASVMMAAKYGGRRVRHKHAAQRQGGQQNWRRRRDKWSEPGPIAEHDHAVGA